MKQCNQCGVTKNDDYSYCRACGEHNNFKIVPPYNDWDREEMENKSRREL